MAIVRDMLSNIGRSNLIVLFGSVGFLPAQDRPPVNYPGWIWADGVEPAIEVVTQYDSVSGKYHYEYSVENGPGAAQDIITFDIQLFEPPPAYDLVTSQAPSGWWTGVYIPRGAIPGIGFEGERPDTPPGPEWDPSPDQIPPGSSLSGFVIESPYPPGYARWYVQGYVPLPYLTEEPDVDLVIPHDTTNSRRGWTLAPTFYARVLAPGDDGTVSDGFLAFMNISDVATVLINPAPIALKFSIYGETVFPETFRASLNGVDVTAAFLPGPPDGADRVGVFRLGSSPLVEGVNTLQTSIEGIELWTQERMVDPDLVKFIIPSECTEQLSKLCR